MTRLWELRRRIDTADGIRIPAVPCLARGGGGSAAGIALGYSSITVPPPDGGPVLPPPEGERRGQTGRCSILSGLGPQQRSAALALLRGAARAPVFCRRMASIDRVSLSSAKKERTLRGLPEFVGLVVSRHQQREPDAFRPGYDVKLRPGGGY